MVSAAPGVNAPVLAASVLAEPVCAAPEPAELAALVSAFYELCKLKEMFSILLWPKGLRKHYIF